MVIPARNSETLEVTLLYKGEIKTRGIKTGLYRHFKGKNYQLIGTTKRENTTFVVYKALYEDKEFGKESVWLRPKQMFFEKVKNKPRFEYVGE